MSSLSTAKVLPIIKSLSPPSIHHPWQLKNPLVYDDMDFAPFGTKESSTVVQCSYQTRHLVISMHDWKDDDHFLDDITKLSGEIRAVYPNLTMADNTTVAVISYYRLSEAKACLDSLAQGSSDYHISYAKPCCINKKMNERMFVTISYNSMKMFNYMEYLTRIGKIHSISEAKLSSTCILINLEYDDERDGERLLSSLNNTMIQNVQFNVYDATNDKMKCTCYRPLVLNESKETQQAIHPTVFDSYFSSAPFTDVKKTLLLDSPPLEPTLLSKKSNNKSEINNVTHSIHQLVLTPESSTEMTKSTSSGSRRASSHSEESAITKDMEVKNSLDLEKIRNGQDRRTTFMIRNIPNKYTQKMIIDCINTTHKGTYDFLYLRIDFQNKCNVGYAFINFIDPKDVISFAEQRVGRKWKLFNSDKKCDLCYANIQGKDALIKKFKNSQVMHEESGYQPKLFHTSGPERGREQKWPNVSDGDHVANNKKSSRRGNRRMRS